MFSHVLVFSQRFTIALNSSDTNFINRNLDTEDVFLLPSGNNFFYGAFTEKAEALAHLQRLGADFPKASIGNFSATMIPLIWSYAREIKVDDPYHPDFSKFYPDLILFQPAQAYLTSEATEKLDELAQTLLDFPYLKLILQGHTDTRGDSKFNMQLSKQRAIQVRNYLIKKGIHQDRIQTKALADYAPFEVKSVHNDDGRFDRRVDFIVTGSPESVDVRQVNQKYDLPTTPSGINP